MEIGERHDGDQTIGSAMLMLIEGVDACRVARAGFSCLSPFQRAAYFSRRMRPHIGTLLTARLGRRLSAGRPAAILPAGPARC